MDHRRLALIVFVSILPAEFVFAMEPAVRPLSGRSSTRPAEKAGDRADVGRFFAEACRQARKKGNDRTIESLQKAAETGELCQTRCLTEPALIGLHEDRRFRDLMRSLARQSEIVLAPPEEPGESMVVSGRVVDDDLKPVKDALLYVYHTNNRGSYSSTGGNATMGDSLNPRLFGYVRTDAAGHYQFRTIRPGPYPGDGPPAHIHYEAEAIGHRRLVTELMFEGDPRLTRDNRRSFVQAGFAIAKVTKDEDGVQRCVCDLVMNRKVQDSRTKEKPAGLRPRAFRESREPRTLLPV